MLLSAESLRKDVSLVVNVCTEQLNLKGNVAEYEAWMMALLVEMQFILNVFNEKVAMCLTIHLHRVA